MEDAFEDADGDACGDGGEYIGVDACEHADANAVEMLVKMLM